MFEDLWFDDLVFDDLWFDDLVFEDLWFGDLVFEDLWFDLETHRPTFPLLPPKPWVVIELVT